MLILFFVNKSALLAQVPLQVNQATNNTNYFGAGTNTTFNVKFTVEINMTINSDNTVSGYLDATGLPGGSTICGAGDFSGNKEGSNIEFTFVSQDTDTGCGFDHGNLNTFNVTISPNGEILSGGYTIDNGQAGVIRAISQSSWGNIQPLQNNYTSKIGTNEAAFAHQFSCILNQACGEFAQNGANGWASEGGFVKYVFNHMLDEDGLTDSLKVECEPTLTNNLCFEKSGEIHGDELISAFLGYCLTNFFEGIDYEKWDSDHNSFLNQAVKPCFDEVEHQDELSWLYVQYLKVKIPLLADIAREAVQAICPTTDLSGNLIAFGSSGFPVLPPPPTQNDLYSDSLGEGSTLNVDVGGQFFLPVGTTIQLQITPNNSVTSLVNSRILGTSYEYSILNVSPSIATISNDGELSIISTSSPITSLPVSIYVLVRNGSDWGVGQYAITDVDTDGDLIVDSYELNAGLNPNISNSLSSDLDGDLLIDLWETILGTEPTVYDTDNDGFDDGYELFTGSDPLSADCTPFDGCVSSGYSIYLPTILR